LKYIAVFDTETTSTNPQTACAVQLAAKIIEPRTLTPVPNAEFNMFMRPTPESIDPKTLAWHANRLGKSDKEVLDMWYGYPDPKVIWPEFCKFLGEYNTRQSNKSIFTAPIAAGANIRRFDLPIVARYNEMYGDKTEKGVRPLFAARDEIDLLDWFFAWFENNKDVDSYSMDNIRDYLGMSKDGAHDALIDVKDCTQIIIRFMELFRRTAAKVQFKGAFKR
jgi:DNA polymerase III epsilon subunit-like protein